RHHRSKIVQLDAAPALDIPQEIVRAAVGAEVLSRSSRLLKTETFASGDGHTEPRVRRVLARRKIWEIEGLRVLPIVGEQRVRVRDNGRVRVPHRTEGRSVRRTTPIVVVIA